MFKVQARVQKLKIELLISQKAFYVPKKYLAQEEIP